MLLRYISVLILFTMVFSSSGSEKENVALKRHYFTGDAIRISLLPDSNSFLNDTFYLNSRGEVDLPIVGKVKIDTMSETEFSTFIAESFRDYLRFPTIQIRPMIRVSAQGGFSRPGLYWIEPDASLWRVVELIGGTQRDDGLSKIQWKRNGQQMSEDLCELIESGVSLNEIGFNSGDQLMVTQRPNLTGWEVFRNDVLPVLTVVLTAISTSATLYQLYDTYYKN